MAPQQAPFDSVAAAAAAAGAAAADDDDTSDDSLDVIDTAPGPYCSSSSSSRYTAVAASRVPHASPRRPGLSLDSLPRDVCTRIAAHVCGGSPTKEALQLAELSPPLRSGVLEALGYRLVWDAGSRAVRERWRGVFGNDVVELVFRRKVSGEEDGVELDCSRMPRLERAKLCTRADQLRALCGAPALTDLWVAGPNLKAVGGVLFDTLNSLPRLNGLFLFCEAGALEDCLFADPTYFNHQYSALAEACPRVTHLRLCCYCHNSAHPYWTVLEKMPSLKRVGLDIQHVPDDRSYTILRSMECVDVNQALQPYEVATRIGAPVTTLVSQLALTPSELTALASSCPRLDYLCSIVTDGAEHVLRDMCAKLPRLRILELLWRESDELEVGEIEYTEVSEGCILSAIQSAPALRSLSLEAVVIPVDEVVGIMKHMGRNLEKLATSILCQEQGPLDRLLTILDAAGRYCSGLQSFSVFDHSVAALEIRRVSNDNQLREARLKVEKKLARLRSRAPYLVASVIDESFLPALEPDGT